MPQGTPLNDEDKDLIDEMYDLGKYPTVIARRLGIERQSVINYLRSVGKQC
jgi:DNA invertase Pin-like site-specific DNA recombinase